MMGMLAGAHVQHTCRQPTAPAAAGGELGTAAVVSGWWWCAWGSAVWPVLRTHTQDPAVLERQLEPLAPGPQRPGPPRSRRNVAA